MKKSNTLLAATLAGVLIAGGSVVGGTIWSEATQSSIKVCVNKTTKVIKYKSTCNAKERSLRLSLRGEAGKSAYQIWLDQGYRGTETDFLNFLRGANGAPAIDFARNCYQQLKKAESQGVIWTNPVERARFERVTGCTLRQIDVNPNSNTLARGELFPLITRARLLGRGGGAGDYGDGRGTNSQQIYYEVDVQLPSEYVLCSIDANDTFGPRVFYAPSGQVIALGVLQQSELYFRSILNLGFGFPAENPPGLVDEPDQYDAFPYLLEVRNRLSLPLDSVSVLKFNLIKQSPENPDFYQDNFTIETTNVLSQVIDFDYQDGVLRVEIQTNPAEYGIENLTLKLDGGEVILPLQIGVEQCSHSLDPGLEFDPSSLLYVINEDLRVADSPGIGDLPSTYGWGLGYNDQGAPSWFPGGIK